MTYVPAHQPADDAPLTREERRSLWLNQAIAHQVAEDPERALRLASDNLVKMQALHQRGQAARILTVWEVLLREPLEDMLTAMLSTAQEGRDLRTNSVMAGVLTEQERQAALDAFYDEERRALSRHAATSRQVDTADELDAYVGPFYDTAGVCSLLGGLTKAAVDAKRKDRTVLAVPTADGRWLYPTFQFEDRGVRADLVPAIQALRGSGPWASALWFVVANPDLGGTSPLQWVVAGGSPTMVLLSAQRTAHEWQ